MPKLTGRALAAACSLVFAASTPLPASALDTVTFVERGHPTVAIAAIFQKDPQRLMTPASSARAWA